MTSKYLLKISLTETRSYCIQSKTPGSKYVKPITGLHKYLIKKCISLIKGYEHILETKFPSAFKIYRVFSVGTKDLYKDIKDYLRISSSLKAGKSVRDLKREELEKYFTVPKDLLKVGPVLLVAALPFANYVVLPIIYLFPRHFLSSHFWSLQEKVEFSIQLQKKKLHYYRPVFRHLQAKVSNISNEVLKKDCKEILFKLGSGTHPSVEEILELTSAFKGKPYGLPYLSAKHLHDLCGMHGLYAVPGKFSRLLNHAGILREMDLAIARESLLNMNLHELRSACFLRGLSPMGLSKDEMVIWLSQWILIAQHIDSKSLSLLLHCPILLSYNYSSNWILIH